VIPVHQRPALNVVEVITHLTLEGSYDKSSVIFNTPTPTSVVISGSIPTIAIPSVTELSSPQKLLDNGYRSNRTFSHTLHHDFTVKSEFNNHFRVEACIANLNKAAIITHNLTFTTTNPDRSHLCEGALRILDLPNAGGNSVWSEVMSCELMNSLFNARLMRTEMELEYIFWGCKITDYSVRMFDQDIGVSVTRAMKFKGIFKEEDAVALLSKKLEGVNTSTRCISNKHSWTKQILHVWTQHDYIAEVIANTYPKLDPELTANTLIVITVCKNGDWIFNNSNA